MTDPDMRRRVLLIGLATGGGIAMSDQIELLEAAMQTIPYLGASAYGAEGYGTDGYGD